MFTRNFFIMALNVAIVVAFVSIVYVTYSYSDEAPVYNFNFYNNKDSTQTPQPGVPASTDPLKATEAVIPTTQSEQVQREVITAPGVQNVDSSFTIGYYRTDQVFTLKSSVYDFAQSDFPAKLSGFGIGYKKYFKNRMFINPEFVIYKTDSTVRCQETYRAYDYTWDSTLNCNSPHETSSSTNNIKTSFGYGFINRDNGNSFLKNFQVNLGSALSVFMATKSTNPTFGAELFVKPEYYYDNNLVLYAQIGKGLYRTKKIESNIPITGYSAGIGYTF